ncbi:MAG TPA: MFS transporter [Conexibacter sp.]|jgi:MFS family permease|nr:MFS transporter [Conexibacter sp.]
MRRLLLLVGAIVFVDLMFYAAITPLLPWYADRFDLSKTGAGVLAGSYAAGTLLGALPSGWLATRLGSRRTVLIGLALMAVASVGFAFGRTVAMLDAMRFLQGVGGACTWAGGLGWLISLTPPEERGTTIGKAMSAALGGLLLGPALGALAREVGPEVPFASIAVLGGLLALAALRIEAPAVAAVIERPLATALRNGPIRFGMLLVTVPALVFGAVEVLVPLALDRLGATSIAIAATFVVASGIEAGAQILAGRAADRHGRLWPIRISLAGALAFMLVVPLPDAAWLLAGVTTVGCVMTGALNTPAMALLSDSVETAGIDQGFGFALVNLVWASGQVIGTVAGGALAAATSDGVAYVALAAVCAGTLATMARRGRRPALAGERA